MASRGHRTKSRSEKFRLKTDRVFTIEQFPERLVSCNQSLSVLARSLPLECQKMKENQIWIEKYQKKFGARSYESKY